jgi:hypothetical protein
MTALEKLRRSVGLWCEWLVWAGCVGPNWLRLRFHATARKAASSPYQAPKPAEQLGYLKKVSIVLD